MEIISPTQELYPLSKEKIPKLYEFEIGLC
jgi:hypothetical protein